MNEISQGSTPGISEGKLGRASWPARIRNSPSAGRTPPSKAGGLRSFFEYRDLGLSEATGGRYHAQVIRASAPCEDGTGPHRHALEFQMVYVLKGLGPLRL